MLDSSGRAQNVAQQGRGLSAGLLTEKALEIVNAEGYEALSFRNLGKVAGCEAMSLYHYFKSKAHLRDAMIDRVLAGAEIDQTPGRPLRERIIATARSFRRSVLMNPGLAPVVLFHRLDQTEGARWLGGFAALFAESALPSGEQVQHFRRVWAVMTGALVEELRAEGLVPGAAEPADLADLAKLPGAAFLGRRNDKGERLAAFNAIVAAELGDLPEPVVAPPEPVAQPQMTRAEIRQRRHARRLAKLQQ